MGLDPFTRQATMFSEQVLEFHPKRAMFLPAGDYCVYYPGYNEPLISVRSEAHRIGFEDRLLLEKVRAIDSEKMTNYVHQMFRTFDDYEKSIVIYRKTKKDIIKYILNQLA